MGSSHQNWFCCHRNRHLIISFIFLLVSSLTQVRFMVEGRAIMSKVNEDEEKMVASMMIGSRPPKCERKCNYCGGHCEAIQVPVTTQAQLGHKRSHFSTIAYSSRSDDISNYKPMSWKCKCGNFIFNP